MKVILLDDEPAMHLILRKMLDKMPGMEVAGAFADSESATGYLREHDDVQLAFVDISMPGESGLKFAERLRRAGNPMHVVFVTSHKEHALDAFDLFALDYLVKPVSLDRLERTVARAQANRQAAGAPALPEHERHAERLVVTALGDVSIGNRSGRAKWISRKCAELFAYLLLHRGKRISRSRLIGDIFAGMTPANAASYLNTAVYQLRKSLEPFRQQAALLSENDGYVLELGEAGIDYAEFESRAGKLAAIVPDRLGEAREIERLYAGDLFGDKAYVWAIGETERLAELYASFAKRLAEALIAASDFAGAMKLLIRLQGRNPLDETVVRLLLKVHAIGKDRKGLTAQYTGYVRLLSRELGIRPSQEMVLLYDSLLTGLSDRKS